MKPRAAIAVGWALSLLVVVGCTHKNVRLNPPEVPLEARRVNHTRAATGAPVTPPQAHPSAPNVKSDQSDDSPREAEGDGCFVGLALSGGGSRSANFSAACMFELQRLGILKHVDYISSVSGGSLTGAYYCLNEDGEHGWNPGNVERVLTRSFASDVIAQVFLPWNTFALLFTDYDRSDLLADSFEHRLFYAKDGHVQTFADLRPDRPRLLINATDLQSGRPFVFCNESFDLLNSDLSKYPISYAVAASAAVPVVMHQVTLRDFATTFDQFRHLIDGGINDNLGIATLVDTYEAHARAAEKNHEPDPYPRGAVFFVLDARTRFDARLDDKGDIGLIESLATGASVTSNALLNRVSSATLADIIVKYSPNDVTAQTLRDQIETLDREGLLTLKDRRGHKVTVIHLSLARVENVSNLPSHGFFQRLNNIATYFNISPAEAAALYKAAELIVREKYEDQLEAIAHELDGHAPTTRP